MTTELDETTALEKKPTTSLAFGARPETWDSAWRMANAFAKSQLVPKSYQGHAEDILVAMLRGAEVGLAPLAALDAIAVVNGRPALYGDALLALVQTSPAYLKHVEHFRTGAGEMVHTLTAEDLADDQTCAVACFWRKGNPDPIVSEFSIGDAKRAGLLGKDTYKQYPGRMLQRRARARAVSDGFAAELRGLRPAEELEDVVDQAPEPAPAPVAPVRRSEKAAAAAGPRLHRGDEPATSSQLSATSSQLSDGEQPAPAVLETELPPPAEKPSRKGQPARTSTSAEALQVIGTAYLEPKGAPASYEIKARLAGEPPETFVFSTRDKAVYELAASAEDAPQRFRATWKLGKRVDGSVVKVLESLEPEID